MPTPEEKLTLISHRTRHKYEAREQLTRFGGARLKRLAAQIHDFERPATERLAGLNKREAEVVILLCTEAMLDLTVEA